MAGDGAEGTDGTAEGLVCTGAAEDHDGGASVPPAPPDVDTDDMESVLAEADLEEDEADDVGEESTEHRLVV